MIMRGSVEKPVPFYPKAKLREMFASNNLLVSRNILSINVIGNAVTVAFNFIQ